MPFTVPENSKALAACQTHLKTHLKNNLKERSFLGTQQVYIRDRIFIDEVSAKGTILTVINNDATLSMHSPTKKKKLAAEIHSKGLRMFVICAHGKVRMECLRLMLQKGFTDKSLPLKEFRLGNKYFEHDFKKFIESQSIIDIIDISVPAWSALTPGSFVGNIVATDEPLPMQSEAYCGEGAAAIVWTCRFDTMHQDNFKAGNTSIADKTLSHRLAVKVFSDHVQANRERSFVDFLEMNQIQHEHVVKFHFGFEYRGKYHLASQLAEQCLTDRFAKTESNIHDRPWLRLQITGLVDALKTIHGPTNGTTAFHHDIKPENILVFGKDDGYKLKLADFGAAGFDHNYTPGVRSRKTHAQGDSYLPPEYINDQRTSRPHDVWSLGCVLVELCVWYFHGWVPNGLLQLKNDITEAKNNHRLCWFIETPLSDEELQSGVVAVSPRPLVLVDAVLRKLEALREQNTNMSKVVDVLSKMLNIDPVSRITAARAFAELNAIPVDWEA
ncbi:hypothetical protein HBH56_051930 [Parastagonospora nodorum]|uniref:Protein kinase domain-containing protein n=1 Tax=Phaeosphaeria nodorum (strain SN15 / ATCC MYA-4574 / FGSC 10173) TaxID=321614 RepID=A0A7U2FBB1_PHANO|nr:hypothetical protein HBH56_051930 [Parastagonospora nodorum]QRD02138.1 hypothetical protein JI435_051150 [Parastagonospora nodorum SN15]KAH3935598.1 hypothetical protein HBH54_037720 [Parastagonospora nodorum]KAH3948597.1 hypothetical protein HBH53_101440 [Parastagonospora nodorum]KAH3969996.1 hypothetical protein HBH51_117690 [Parastagonospora nodorum]